MILDDIVAARRVQLIGELKKVSFADMKLKALCSQREPLEFRSALKEGPLSVIAEVKKASPSKGLIQPDFHPVEIAKAYEEGGANAISCLTEEHYFQGSSDYLVEIRKAVSLPILRKDFIIDPYQIYEAKVIGADAILLIAAILNTAKLKEFMAIAGELGLYCLCEVHNEKELDSVLEAGGELIGINNRDLKTFHVDLETTGRLKKLIPEGKVVVSESGIATNEDMQAVDRLGADAVLIGETLMRSGDSKAELHRLRAGLLPEASKCS